MTSLVHAAYAVTSGQCQAWSRATVRPSTHALEARLIFLIMAVFLVAGTALSLWALSVVTAFQQL